MAVNIREVAERAGVSVGTVSNVLNAPAKVAPATVLRVQTAIADLGFVRNDAARQLRAGRSRSIGLIVLDIRNPFFTDVASGAEERASAEGLSVLLANSDERADRESAYLDLFEEQRVRGILISPIAEVIPRLQQLRERGIPSVLVDRLAGTPGFSSVSVDDEAGGRMAVEHLIATGRSRIAFVGGPMSTQQVADRLAGARAAAAAHPGVRLSVHETSGLTVDVGVAAGLRLAEADDRPDAVFAANDLVALGVLQGLGIIAGRRVPDEIAIVGYDDIDFAASAAVPITSIRQPRDRIGAQALELLLAELDGDPEHHRIVFQPELIVRASSRARP
jgi:LacI family transcriptional regulator